jgi:hypothetical protein
LDARLVWVICGAEDEAVSPVAVLAGAAEAFDGATPAGVAAVDVGAAAATAAASSWDVPALFHAGASLSFVDCPDLFPRFIVMKSNSKSTTQSTPPATQFASIFTRRIRFQSMRANQSRRMESCALSTLVPTSGMRANTGNAGGASCGLIDSKP